MLTSFLILFGVTFLAGLVVYAIPKWKGEQFNLALVFSGSYLFAITVIHILPELFDQQESRQLIGAMILVGFFLQMILEFFSSGVEHGHIHSHQNHEHHTLTASITMLVALCFHAFMEGTLLAHPSTIHDHHQSDALLLGILFHKVPAAFALMSIVTCQFESKKIPLFFLLIFALASPLGLAVSDYFVHEEMVSDSAFVILFALVCGSFLKISTTIFFESNPDHQFGIKRILVSVIAAGLAILAEYLF